MASLTSGGPESTAPRASSRSNKQRHFPAGVGVRRIIVRLYAWRSLALWLGSLLEDQKCDLDDAAGYAVFSAHGRTFILSPTEPPGLIDVTNSCIRRQTALTSMLWL